MAQVRKDQASRALRAHQAALVQRQLIWRSRVRVPTAVFDRVNRCRDPNQFGHGLVRVTPVRGLCRTFRPQFCCCNMSALRRRVNAAAAQNYDRGSDISSTALFDALRDGAATETTSELDCIMIHT